MQNKFTSPELKVSYSDRVLFIVCLSIYQSIRLLIFHIFIFFSRTTGPNLAQSILGRRGFVEVPCPFWRGGNKDKLKRNSLANFKNLLLQNYWANFIQIWYKASSCDGDLNLFKWRATPFFEGRLKRNSKNTLTKFKNLFQEPLGQFQPNLTQSIPG